jgi:hypothetical protein
MTTFKLGRLTIDAVGYGVFGNAILGIKESGKSYLATEMAEHLFDAGIPFVAFDPIGVWRFLRIISGRLRGRDTRPSQARPGVASEQHSESLLRE